jgi:hypothetical protein
VYLITVIDKRGAASPIIALAVGLLLSFLAFLGLFRGIDGRFYDFLLGQGRIRPPARELLLVEADEDALAAEGPLPWGGESLARGLSLLTEFGAQDLVLDLPLAREGEQALDKGALGTLPGLLEKEFAGIESNVTTLFDGIRLGSVRPQDAGRFVSELKLTIDESRARLVGALSGAAGAGGELFRKEARLQGRVWLPVELATAAEAAHDEATAWALRNFTLTGFKSSLAQEARAGGLLAPDTLLLRGARGGGFRNQILDADGRERRAALITAIGADRLPNLAFAALLDNLGEPAIEAKPGRLILKDALLPGKEARDLVLPLTEEGYFLIDWRRPGGVFDYRRLSWGELSRVARLEANLLEALKDMDGLGLLTGEGSSLLDLRALAATLEADILESGDSSRLGAWRDARQRYFAQVGSFLNGEAEKTLPEDARSHAAFETARAVYKPLAALRATLAEKVSSSFCIVASSLPREGGGRTSLGDPALEGRASAAIVDSVLASSFITELPPRWAPALGLGLSLLVALSALLIDRKRVLVLGLALALTALAGSALGFLGWRLWLGPSGPVFAVLGAALGAGLAGLLASGQSRARSMRRAARAGEASSGLLAPAGLGPEPAASLPVAVLSIRAKGLLAAAAAKGAGGMAAALEAYHYAMRVLARDSEGLVTRVEGEVVTICLLEPRPGEASARARACRAAKDAQRALPGLAAALERLGLPAAAWSLRLGLDAGDCLLLEASETRLLQIVGPAVDFATRLAGLSSRFGSPLLVADRVLAGLEGELASRRLGLLRDGESGRELWVFDLPSAAGGEEAGGLDEATAAFHEALALYAAGETARALPLFGRVAELLPGDGPAAHYAKLCREAIG